MKTVYGAYAALHLEALAILSQENHRSFERDAYNKVRFYRQRLRELEKDARMSRRRVEQLVQIRESTWPPWRSPPRGGRRARARDGALRSAARAAEQGGGAGGRE